MHISGDFLVYNFNDTAYYSEIDNIIEIDLRVFVHPFVNIVKVVYG